MGDIIRGSFYKWVTKQHHSVSFPKTQKIRTIRFVGNFILNICGIFLDNYVIIVTSSVHKTQPICVLFSPLAIYHNMLAINSIKTRKCNKVNNLISLLSLLFPFFQHNLPSLFKHFVPSVKKFLNAWCKERCCLLSQSLMNKWLHLGIWWKFLPI